MARTLMGDQGEITFYKIDEIPTQFKMKKHDSLIISHSESGNNHVLTCGEVMERTEGVPAGMKIFYAILDEPAELVQDGASPHGKHSLISGFYEFRIAREHDHFANEARRVQD